MYLIFDSGGNVQAHMAVFSYHPKSTAPKTHRNETPIWIQERVIDARKETNKCALKLQLQAWRKKLRISREVNNIQLLHDREESVRILE